MKTYEPPGSDVANTSSSKFQPTKAIILGLLVTVVLALIVSIFEGIVVSILLDVNLSDKNEVNAILSNNTVYLVVDLLIMSFILYFAGRVVRKYTPNKEIIFGMILSILTLAIYLSLALTSNAFSVYPSWYNVLTIVLVFSAILIGAKPRNKY